jgi:DNA invertase Pin-like site-specific DNA recombinase
MARRKAIGYVRVSTQEQVSGFGLDVQDQALRTYCRQHELRLVDVARDEGQSGSNGLDTRAGLAEALALLERGEAEVLVVYRLDRLARDLLLQETLMARLRQHGAEVLSVSEPDVDSDDPTRVLVRQVLGAISQYERAVIRGRMMAGRAAKRASGGYSGGQPRYGTKAEDRQLAPNDEERPIVDLITRARAAGKSYRDICGALENAGYRPRRAQRWQPAVVRRIALRGKV